MNNKKMGRPTDNPKGKSIHIRLDVECDTVLDAYMQRKNVSRTDAIRTAIKLLKEQ